MVANSLQSLPITTESHHRLWMPEQVLFTAAALDEDWGQQILTRVESLGTSDSKT